MSTSNSDGTFYHNPRCSKSRASLELLKDNNINPDIVLYLDNPPDENTLKQVLSKLGMSPKELLRPNEQECKDLNLLDSSVDDSSVIKAMVKHPKLIERPIYVKDERAIIGRPPEQILDIV